MNRNGKGIMNILKEDKLLVVAPHPDDESIGVGGLLALYGPQCDVLLITDGRHGHMKTDINEDELANTRLVEINEACKLAKVNKLYYLKVKDRSAFRNKKKIFGFDIRKYTKIFIPNKYESNIDHAVIYPFFKDMINEQNKKVQLYQYEVWNTIVEPTDYLDITEVVDIKRKMIECHKSQLLDCNFVQKAIALNIYRGMKSHLEYAEAYYLENNSIKKVIRALIPKPLLFKIKDKIK